MQDPEQVARRFFEELWNQRRLETADEIVAHDCVTHQLRSAAGATAKATRSPLALKEHIRAWLAAFPDLRWEIEAMVANQDHATSWVVGRGTHRSAWQGIPPTGREVVIRSVVMHRVVGGRITEDWVLTDGLGIFQQLGLVPPTPVLLQQSG